MKYISVFSGVEAASVAWEPLGWEPVAFSEIDPFPCAVLADRFPQVPNLGDISNIDWSAYRGTIDLVAGGSPCQSFSVAGKREGLAGASGLMWEYIRCVRDVMPRYFIWENVPGALSSEGGAAFRQLLQSMDDLGYNCAWRVLDAQFFGIAQRRRRVFLVGCLADGRAAEILFERESMRWDFATGKRERARLTADSERGVGGSRGERIGNPVVYQKTARPRNDMECEKYAEAEIACTLNTFDVGETRANELVIEPADKLLFENHPQDSRVTGPCDVSPSVVRNFGTGGGNVPIVMENPPRYIVRRLTPTECERLQGFPDGWTDITYRGKPAADSPRYKAMGNSMAVPVMRWIGERIQMVDEK